MNATKKVVINKCFGGFSLSARAIARWAELQGRPCYFFVTPFLGSGKGFGPRTRVTVEEADKSFMFSAFDMEDVSILNSPGEWHEMTMEQRLAHNALYNSHSYDIRPEKRDDPLLIQVVEELGAAANGAHAELRIVEIPADVDYNINDYDGVESIHEVHRSW